MNTLNLRKTIQVKDGVAAILIVLLTAFLVLFSMYSSDVILSERLNAAMNKHLLYQPVTLIATLSLLALLAILYGEKFKTYFKVGRINAKVIAEPYVGINPKPHDNWLSIGLNFLIVISIVTAVVIFFQFKDNTALNAWSILSNLPTVFLFALCNAFVEESITRLAPVILLKDKIADKHIAIISAVLFGIAHYWGTPGGPAGVLFAGFLGWLLAKSILETKGIFWALLIHFVQDVIILSAFMATQS